MTPALSNVKAHAATPGLALLLAEFPFPTCFAHPEVQGGSNA